MVISKHLNEAANAVKAVQVLLQCKMPDAIFFGGVRGHKMLHICTAKSQDFAEIFPLIPQYSDTSILAEWQGGTYEVFRSVDGVWEWIMEKMEV